MHITRRLILAMAVVAVAACSGSGAGTSSAPTSASSVSSTAGTPAAAASSLAAATRVAVKLTDALRMDPAAFAVPHGVPVTFVVTNVGAIDHEFFLGDEAAQAAHEMEMGGMSGMGHDDANGITMKAGETKELTFTFPQGGMTFAGCHVPGHYPGGMKAQITVG